MRLQVFFALAILATVAAASMQVPAVDADGKGVLSIIESRAVSGKGDIFVAVTPLMGVDTQQSEKLAVKIAAEQAAVDASKYDVTMQITSDAEIVDGPSAGAALALLTYAEFAKKGVRKDITMTGTIESDGSIGKVGGVFEKAIAVAAEKKFKAFLIPRGQAIANGIDLREYGKKQGLQVVEVARIGQVIEFATNTTEGSALQVKEETLPALDLLPYPTTRKPEAFSPIASEQIQTAEALLAQIKDNSTAIAISAADSLNTSRQQLAKGYAYSAANTAFLVTLALEETAMLNDSKEQFGQKLLALQSQAEAMKFAKPTRENAEWLASAKMRYYWALEKISEASDRTAALPTAYLVEYYALAKEWLSAAVKLNAIAQKIGGDEISELALRKEASRLMGEADALKADNALAQDGLDNLAASKLAFQNSDYLAASFTLQFVLAYADADADTDGKTYGEIFKALCGDAHGVADCVPQEPYQDGSAWGELYEAHGYYYLQEANRTGEAAYLSNSLKMVYLAEALDGLMANVSEAPMATQGSATPTPAASAPANPKLGVQVSVSAPVPGQNNARDIVLLLVAGIVALIAILAYTVGRRTTADANERKEGHSRRLDRLDDMLTEGKISEANYDRLRQKYTKLAGKENEPPQPEQPEVPEQPPAWQQQAKPQTSAKKRGAKSRK
ncbi:MAG: S16 family serine protease [Candidatus Micrarchaeota archaeon]